MEAIDRPETERFAIPGIDIDGVAFGGETERSAIENASWLPTPEQIAAGCAEARESWTDLDYRTRTVQQSRPVEFPVVRSPDL